MRKEKMENKPTDKAVISAQPARTKNTKKPYIVTIVVLAILTLGGVGFGVWGMISANQAKSEVATLEMETVDYTDAEEETVPETEIDDEVVATEAETVSSDGYIYVGEWGIKIAIPAGLQNLSYVFNGVNDVLYISAATENEIREARFVTDSINQGRGLGAIGRYQRQDFTGDVVVGQKAEFKNGFSIDVVFIDGDNVYTYTRQQDGFGDETVQRWEIDSSKVVESMIHNNISTF